MTDFATRPKTAKEARGRNVLERASVELVTDTSYRNPVEQRAFALLKIVAWGLRRELTFEDVSNVANALCVDDPESCAYAADRIWDRAIETYDALQRDVEKQEAYTTVQRLRECEKERLA